MKLSINVLNNNIDYNEKKIMKFNLDIVINYINNKICIKFLIDKKNK